MKTKLVLSFLLIGHLSYAAFLPVCERTPEVAAELQVLAKKPCAEITEADLAPIKRVAVPGRNITALKTGDFSGLPSLEILNIMGNPLITLPEGLMAELPNLKTIVLFGMPIRFLPHDFLLGNEKLENLHMFENENLLSLSVSVLTRLEAMKNLKVVDLDKRLGEAERVRLRKAFPEGGIVELTFY